MSGGHCYFIGGLLPVDGQRGALTTVMTPMPRRDNWASWRLGEVAHSVIRLGHNGFASLRLFASSDAIACYACEMGGLFILEANQLARVRCDYVGD